MKLLFYSMSVIIIIIALLSFHTQESARYYYAFNEKIALIEIQNKLVVRYSQTIRQDIVSQAIKNTFSDADQQWYDETTVIISVPTSSKGKRDEMIKNFRGLPEVISCNPSYKVDGAERGLTDEFLVKFKKGVSYESQSDLHKFFNVNILKRTDDYILCKVASNTSALDIANQYQESGLVEFSYPNFLTEYKRASLLMTFISAANGPYTILDRVSQTGILAPRIPILMHLKPGP